MKIFRTWTFKWWEVSFLKIGLMSFGIILGVYFYDYLARLMWLWWAFFIITTIYFIIKMIKENKEVQPSAPSNNPQ